MNETEWPTPSFDRADTMYTCSKCGATVSPPEEKQAALLIAGQTLKVCGDCAAELRTQIIQEPCTA